MDEINTLTPSQAAVAGGAAGAMIGMMTACLVVYYIFTVIATWKIFKKAGEPGWKCLIPIYNVYIMFKIVNMKSWFWWYIAITICASIMISVDLPNLSNMTEAEINHIDWGQHPMSIIASLMTIVVGIYVEIVYAWRTSKVFGHGAGYFIGLLFLQPIFWLILGFDKSKYDKKALKKAKK